MAKVGRFVTDPMTGSYCHITLDSGEKIIVSHEKNRLAVELSSLLGFASDSVFVCHLDTAPGQAALSQLTRGAQPGTTDATPLGALVKYIKHCGTAADVKVRCNALAPLEEPRP